MKCENIFCVYQNDGICILDSIEIDITGQCSNCMYTDIPEKDLDKYKVMHRNRIAAY